MQAPQSLVARTERNTERVAGWDGVGYPRRVQGKLQGALCEARREGYFPRLNSKSGLRLLEHGRCIVRMKDAQVCRYQHDRNTQAFQHGAEIGGSAHMAVDNPRDRGRALQMRK